MIGYLRGRVLSLQPDYVLLEANGVGYEVICSGAAFANLSGVPKGEEGEVYTYLQVSEQGVSLFGFADLREKYKIILVACIPYRGQERGMESEDRELYRMLLDACDERIVLHEAYRHGCFLERDRYMVEHADVVLAYCTQDEGGTAYTVRYAAKMGIEVVFLEC